MGMFAVMLILLSGTTAYAYVSSENSDTGYELIIDDTAGYFTEEDTSDLKDIMEEITEYCNAALVTTEYHNCYSTENFAVEYYESVFSNRSDGIIFVIDRDLNEIYLCSFGGARGTITNSKAYSITDNTYVYATSSYDYDYFTCAYKTMEQVLTLMEGRRIAEPMKYICSAILAIIVALLINYFVVMFISRSRKPNIGEILSGTYSNVRINNAKAEFQHQTKTYSPQSSGSGGGGGGHSGGGGGGHSGGGHSI